MISGKHWYMLASFSGFQPISSYGEKFQEKMWDMIHKMYYLFDLINVEKPKCEVEDNYKYTYYR